jgi:DNA repair protein RadC
MVPSFLQSLANLMGASMEELAKCPGIGEKKVQIRDLLRVWNCTHVFGALLSS